MHHKPPRLRNENLIPHKRSETHLQAHKKLLGPVEGTLGSRHRTKSTEIKAYVCN
jgi:hypothetical protein